MVIIFLIVLIALIVGSLAYSKAYKVKNLIINTIEEDLCWSTEGPTVCSGSSGATESSVDRIADSLSQVGYRSATDFTYSDCIQYANEHKPSGAGYVIKYPETYSTGYTYCVIKYTLSDSSYYYGVVTFMRFDFPILGEALQIPVYGETKIMGRRYR